MGCVALWDEITAGAQADPGDAGSLPTSTHLQPDQRCHSSTRRKAPWPDTKGRRGHAGEPLGTPGSQQPRDCWEPAKRAKDQTQDRSPDYTIWCRAVRPKQVGRKALCSSKESMKHSFILRNKLEVLQMQGLSVPRCFPSSRVGSVI